MTKPKDSETIAPVSSQAPAPPQGTLCESTSTPRYSIGECKCHTYKGNLGPCASWFEGGRFGHCVYCDHERNCHLLVATVLEKLWLAAQPSGDSTQPAEEREPE
jgi:hypothetical protein